MLALENPADAADEAQTALRTLAHATRTIDDPRQIHAVLGSLTPAVTSMSQSLHQIASFHDGGPPRSEWMSGASAKMRSASYRVSWDLHRAGEMLRQIGKTIDHAHEAETVLAYPPNCPEHSRSTTAASDHRIGL